MLVACGAVGSPVPPENVGVNPTIERQKKLEALDEKQREAAAAAESTEPQPDPMLQGQDIDLPRYNRWEPGSGEAAICWISIGG